MKHEEWTQLDDLLNKEGYGGYYDLLELLKDYIKSWSKDKFGIGNKKYNDELDTLVAKIKTLHQATNILSAIELGTIKVNHK